MYIKQAIRDRLDLSAQRIDSYQRRRVKLREFKAPVRRAIYDSVRLTGEQKASIDRLYRENYGKPVTDLWHRHFTAFTGNFDVHYFPEHLYLSEFEFYMNLDQDYARVFEDKNILPMIAAAAHVRMPQPLLSCSRGLCRDGLGQLCTPDRAAELLCSRKELFAKPSVDSGGGAGCRLLAMENGCDTRSGLTAARILRELGDDYVVQEVLHCHESIRRIYPHSVNTFRVITYRWKDEICFMPVILRIGGGGNFVDNVSSGGMFIAVDPDGRLHDRAFTEFNRSFREHPDTHTKFADCRIDHMDRILEAARTMHRFVPQLGCINWDFTLDQSGEPVLIEMNSMYGSIDMLQMAHGSGPFGERTPEILRWLQMMKRLSLKDQVLHRFGK